MLSGDETHEQNYELLFLIVKDAIGSELIKTARKKGVAGGTVFYGYGTIRSSALKFLGLKDVRKEIVLIVAEKELASELVDFYTARLKLYKQNSGIAFTIPLEEVIGQAFGKNGKHSVVEEEKEEMYKAIFTIVEREQSEDVIDAAEKAGSKGGTVIYARGSGVTETRKLFAMEIEPEKAIVLVLAEKDNVQSIVDSISTNLGIEEPNSGIIFTTSVSNAKGLFA